MAMTMQEQCESDTLEDVLLRERARFLAFARQLGAGEEAEDVLHDAWIRVRMLDRAAPGDPLPYLYRLLHNLVIDRHRAARSSVRRDTLWADLSDGGLHGRSELPDGERQLLALEEVRAVYEAIDALGEPTAMIFRRHRMQGQAQGAIAAELGMGLSTVEKHLRRAYAMLVDFRRGRDDG